MRKLRTYKGKILKPSMMQTKSIEAYLKWCDEYLEWCLDDDGRVNAYDSMTASMTPYMEELERRKKTNNWNS